MAKAHVNPDMLVWARERAGLSHADLRRRSTIAWLDKVPDWEEGKANPTFEQARQLAKWLFVPFGFLFMRRPPALDIEIPDLRTVGDRPGELTVDLQDVVMDAQRKQAWLRDYRKDHGFSPIRFVGASKPSDPPRTIANRLARALDLRPEDRESTTVDGYRALLVRKAEIAGLIVLQTGQVGNNTRRLLSVEDFRGFALVDRLAPLIFVNTQDVPPARTFTIAHELAHVALGVSGVSNAPLVDEDEHDLRDVEKVCNQVAAELLVPQDVFEALWRSGDSLDENAKRLSRAFRVSQLVVARRAFDLGLFTANAVYWKFVKRRISLAQTKREKLAEAEGGPGFFKMVKARNGAFAAEVLSALDRGDLLYRDAGRLLGVRPENMDRIR